jgi:formylglycine-generating enzyme required for sulfatase activity
MVAIPGGTLRMGSDAGYPRERNGGEVTVAGFCMDATEVTTAVYTRCVTEGKCSADHLGRAPAGRARTPQQDQCNYGVSDRGDHPVNCVDWGQADAYCKAYGKRLPTEEEWEYVARGGDEARLYPWLASAPHEGCWYREGTCPVASHTSSDSRWGVHDMAGNVWEWTSSRYCDYPLPSRRCQQKRVIRGGGWNTSDWSLLRGANRGAGDPSERGGALGFRCARDPGAAAE